MIENQELHKNEEDGHPEESRSEENSASERTLSDRGSIAHPYRTFLDDTSFARCFPTSVTSCGIETYARSLSMLGNGIPVWDPVGNLDRPKHHLKSGVMIGDVGFLTLEGDFLCYFNIFLPSSTEVQFRCPPNMESLQPSLQSDEVLTHANHFARGTVLLSPGVDMTQVSASPLDLQFTVKARECGILVLPDGASREDLVSTTRIRDYVQKHALEWYTFYNGGRGHIVYPNGSLCVVTGYDKATTWANTTSDPSRLALASILSNCYKDGKFLNNDNMLSQWSQTEYGTEKCAVFIRAMRVAVNVRDWTKHVLANAPPIEIPYYNMLNGPVLGLRARLYTLKEQRLHPKEKCVSRGRQCIFHPLEIILHILLNECPTADVAVAEDSMWCHLTDKIDKNPMAQTMQLLIKILETHDVYTADGIVTLVPVQSKQPQDASSSLSKVLLHIPTFIQNAYSIRRRHREIVHKITRVFPGPSMPADTVTYE